MAASTNDKTTPMPVELDPDLQDQVEWFMQHMLQNFQKKVGEPVSFVCGHAITYLVLDSLPGSVLAWFINDSPLVMDPSRVLYNKGNIDITDLTPGDTGVYTCLVEWGPKKARQNITVGVYSLQVITDSPMRYVFESDSMQLGCHSISLGRLFPLAVRQWLFNSTNVTSPLPTLAINISDDLVFGVTKSMDGVWECQVDDPNTTRTWNTAWYRIKVDDPPSFLERTYQYMLDHIGFVIISTIILLAFSCLCFMYSVYRMKNKEDETDEEFLNTRNGWEEKFLQLGVDGKVIVEDDNVLSQDGDNNDRNKDEEKRDRYGGSKSRQQEQGLDENEREDYRNEMYKDRKMRSVTWKEQMHDVQEYVSDDNNQNDDDDDDYNEVNRSTSHLQQRRKRREKRRPHIHLKLNKSDVKNVNDSKKNNRELVDEHLRRGDKNLQDAKKSRKHKRSNFDIERKHKQVVMHPEVSKGNAFRWLLKNSPHLRKIDSILQEDDNNQIPDLEKKLNHDSSIKIYDQNIAMFSDTMGDSIAQGQGCELYTQQVAGFKGKSSSSDARVDKRDRSRTEAMSSAEMSLQRSPGKIYKKRTKRLSGDISCSTSANTIQRSSVKLSDRIPATLKSWIERGRERIRSWTSKRSSWDGHSDVRYTVLPQADGHDFVDV